MAEKSQLRLIRHKEQIWINSKDVADYLSELAAGEETDTRDRIETAAQHIRNMK